MRREWSDCAVRKQTLMATTSPVSRSFPFLTTAKPAVGAGSEEGERLAAASPESPCQCKRNQQTRISSCAQQRKCHTQTQAVIQSGLAGHRP